MVGGDGQKLEDATLFTCLFRSSGKSASGIVYPKPTREPKDIVGYFEAIPTFPCRVVMEDDIRDEFGGFSGGFPRQLPEDCVEYTVYLIDARIQSQKEIVTRLEEIRKEALQLAKDLLQDYIWQRESFDLKIETKGLREFYSSNVFTNYS